MVNDIKKKNWLKRSWKNFYSPLRIVTRKIKYNNVPPHLRIPSQRNEKKPKINKIFLNTEFFYVFPIINWGFRFQRPQHLSRQFAMNGKIVLYFTTDFNISQECGYNLHQIESNVFEVRLNSYRNINIYTDTIDSDLEKFWMKSISKLEKDFCITSKIIKVDHPFWVDLTKNLSGFCIYDCMDDHSGFEENIKHTEELENKAVIFSDMLIVSSDKLFQKFAFKHKNCVLIENACDYEFFSNPTTSEEVDNFNKTLKGNYVIGYFGAIANWFDVYIVEYLCKEFPDYDFVLIGSTYGCDQINQIKNPNLHILGEKPYNILPSYLSIFDICLIPFKVIPLTLATNPVKMFEYLCQGKPIISIDLPEVLKYSDVVYTAKDGFEFAQKVIDIKNSNDGKNINNRMQLAQNNSWQHRFLQISKYIAKTKNNFPKVSIIILTYNNLSLTQNCLRSIELYSNYNNLELLIVDNYSTDGSREWLLDYAKNRNEIKLILNDQNLGFSAGNNIGIKSATGEYIIILNNDTFVSPNWIKSLIRHFSDNKVGMVGPVTNNIGNQAMIECLNYSVESDFIRSAIGNYYQNHSSIYEMGQEDGVLAFFCVAIKREVVESVGLLDENFGLGFFEDDDYSVRVRSAGYRIIIADDVLIHHECSASFGKLTNKKREDLFLKNKKYFEQKHNIEWMPHRTSRRKK